MTYSPGYETPKRKNIALPAVYDFRPTALIAVLLATACISPDVTSPTRLPIQRIDFTPVAAVLAEGDTVRFAAIPRDSTGRIVPRTKGRWSSARAEIATIDSLGLVRGIAAGRTTIRVVVDTIAAETEVVVQPRASTSMRDIDAGAEHTCAVTGESKVLCWGGNTFGQLGDSVVNQSVTAIRVAGLTDIDAIVTGDRHTCAIRSSAGALCWGSNSAGQLGDTIGSRKVNAAPFFSLGHIRFRQVSAGTSHTCAVGEDHRIYCWGSNGLGQIDGVPVQPGFRMVASGHGHVCAIALNETLTCWGSNTFGQLGTPGSIRFRSITAGHAFTCGISIDGPAYCWGFNGTGQLGNGTAPGGPAPARVQAPVFTQIDAGHYHACGITATGEAYCWGRNVNGEVQPNGPPIVATPVRAPVSALVLVRAGASHSCGITRAGSFVCWGDPGDGRLGVR